MRKLLKFWKEDCPPCEMLSETFKDIKIDIPMENIYIGRFENQDLRKEYDIKYLPTLIILEDDQVVKKIDKFDVRNKQEIEAWING